MLTRYAMSVVLVFIAIPAFAQDGASKAVLDELHAAPRPKGQSDLNTTQLASAHRERAATMQERTNGLWQSWVVAICRGCGVRERQHSDEDTQAVTDRAHAQLKLAPRVVRPLDALEGRGPAIPMDDGRQTQANPAE